MRRFPETHPADFARLGTPELRERFLVERLIPEAPGVEFASIGYERLVVGGVRCGADPLFLGPPPEFGAAFFCERRELAVVCVEGDATLDVDGVPFALSALDVLYIGKGSRSISIAGEGSRLFLVSAPAHREIPTALARAGEAERVDLGSADAANVRTIRKYVHEAGLESCQLTVGITSLAPGSVWNTMPAHRHERRTELYFYFQLGDGRVVHLCGPPEASRSLIVTDEQVAIAPPWSIHTGSGTRAYSFVWVMAGENRDYADVEPVDQLL